MALESSRLTFDTDYLLDAPVRSAAVFLPAGPAACAAGMPRPILFWQLCGPRSAAHTVASSQGLAELKAWALSYHRRTRNWRRYDAAEFDFVFLLQTFTLPGVTHVLPPLRPRNASTSSLYWPAFTPATATQGGRSKYERRRPASVRVYDAGYAGALRLGQPSTVL